MSKKTRLDIMTASTKIDKLSARRESADKISWVAIGLLLALIASVGYNVQLRLNKLESAVLQKTEKVEQSVKSIELDIDNLNDEVGYIDESVNLFATKVDKRLDAQSSKLASLEKKIDKLLNRPIANIIATTATVTEKTSAAQAPLAPPLQKPAESPKPPKSKPAEIAEELINRGFTEKQAAAIVGNIAAESSCDPTAEAADGSLGYMQWLHGRRVALEQFARKRGKRATDHETQLDFIAYELLWGRESANFDKATSCSKDVRTLAYNIAKHVERPAAWALHQSKQKRMDIAQRTYKEITI